MLMKILDMQQYPVITISGVYALILFLYTLYTSIAVHNTHFNMLFSCEVLTFFSLF